MIISIVTIVYNDVKNIESTLLNVIHQTAFNQIEYIVVDGASTDGTSDIIQRYLSKIDTYICEKDKGIYNAMNKGLRVAKGDYVIFINSGDKLTSNMTIAAVINSIGNNTYDVIYGAYREIYSGDKKSPIIPCRRPQKIWYGPVASHQSVFYRLDFLRTYNLKYDESYKIAADYKLTAQAIKNAKSILQLNICISDFDVSGISSTNQDLGLIEANRVRREVFCWGTIRIYSLSIVLLSARYLKSYLKPLYCLMRYGKIR